MVFISVCQKGVTIKFILNIYASTICKHILIFICINFPFYKDIIFTIMRRKTQTDNARISSISRGYIEQKFKQQPSVQSQDSEEQQEKVRKQKNKKMIKKSLIAYRTNPDLINGQEMLQNEDAEYMSEGTSQRRVKIMKEIEGDNNKHKIPDAVISIHDLYDDENQSDISNISRFIEEKLSRSKKRPEQVASLIQEHQYKRLNDKSFIKSLKKQDANTIFLNKFDQFFRQILFFQVFSPESYSLLIWNIVLEVAILFNLFEVPVALLYTGAVYQSQVQTALGLGLNVTFLIILYIDTLLIRPNVSYYQKGQLISSRLSILKNYLKLQFWFNLISILALTIYLSVYNRYFIYIKILFYFRLYNLYIIDAQIMHIMEFQRISFGLYRLARLVVFFWYLATIAGGIFFAIDYGYYIDEKSQYFQNDQLWLTNSPAVGNLSLITDYQWPVWYSYGLYWSLQTASTVGYGDVTPMNPPQVTFAVIAILIMTILFAFYVNTIWTILSDMREISISNTQHWKKLTKYLKNNEISSRLKQRISNSLYQLWEDNINNQIQEQIIKKKISKELREEFYMEYKQLFYNGIPFFSFINHQIIPTSVLKNLVHIITEFTVLQKTIIYREGSIDMTLYFLMKGDIKLTIDGSLLGQTVHSRQNFGIQSFFLQNARNHSACSNRLSKIWKIQYQDFKRVIYSHIFLKEKFNQLNTRLKNQKQCETAIQLLNYRCWQCSSRSHFINQCPLINTWQDKLGISKKNIEDYQSRVSDAFLKQKRRYSTRNSFRCKKIILYRNKKKTYTTCQEKAFNFHSFFPNFNIQLI